MKKRVRKLFLMASILCVVSLVVCACGGKKLEQIDAVETAPTQQPEESGETPSEEKASTLESFTENTFEKWEDSNPNLEGSIKELQEGQFTVVEAITEKADNGGDIVVSPGNGDDSEFNKVTVTYDENTIVAIQTIKNGGDSYEVSEATADFLSEGHMVKVWGTPSSNGLKATWICIVMVV